MRKQGRMAGLVQNFEGAGWLSTRLLLRRSLHIQISREKGSAAELLSLRGAVTSTSATTECAIAWNYVLAKEFRVCSLYQVPIGFPLWNHYLCHTKLFRSLVPGSLLYLGFNSVELVLTAVSVFLGPLPYSSFGDRAHCSLQVWAQHTILCVKLCGNLKYYQSNLYSTVVPPDEITVNYRHGLPLITLTLPSRKERCQFVVKPMLTTVGSFLQDLQNEDKGIKTAAIFTADGSEIAASTLMEVLLMNDFKLVINKITYDVQCPKKEKLSREQTTEMENMKSLVHRLFTALHLEEFQKKREHHLLEKIDHLKGQLQPLEQMKAKIEDRSEAKTSGLLWAGLAVLSVQGGAMAWLTWWVYSWDIMEPVTYFITFANSMVFFAYFIVTRQDYTYSAVKSRQFLHFFHKKSKQQHFDVVQYNQLKEDLAKVPYCKYDIL
ncbi:coiled-coil domain-containing protein 109B [Camelus ferus]|nr:coiled-coil domain-containing protein 109B [Camelus ferus]